MPRVQLDASFWYFPEVVAIWDVVSAYILGQMKLDKVGWCLGSLWSSPAPPQASWHHPGELILVCPDRPGVERPSREIQEDPAGSMPMIIPGNFSLGWNGLGFSLAKEFL